MKPFNRRVTLVAVGALALALGASTSWAQTETAPEKKLLDGAAILDQHVEKSGGKAAYEKLKNRVSKAKLEMPAMGMSFSMTIYQTSQNFLYQKMDLGAMGSQEGGCDGKIAWEKSTMGGARLLSGLELQDAVRQATFNAEVNWRTLYASAKTEGVETINGKPAYKVKLMPKAKGSKPEFHFYDQETFRLVRTLMSQAGQAGGGVEVKMTFTDWKTVDGITVPMAGDLEAGPQKLKMTFESVKHNQEIPPAIFELPPDVKKLLERRRAKEEKDKGGAPSSQPKSGPKQGG